MTAATGGGARRRFMRGCCSELIFWLVMVVLVGGSLLAAYFTTQTFALPLDLAIAFLQVGLILAFFMQLRGARALILLTFFYASIFILVMFALTFNDLFTRV